MSSKLKFYERVRVISVFLIVISFVLIGGGSYALWSFSHESEVNDITSYSAEIEFLESDSKVINIADAFPMTDEVGKKQDESFDFQVKTKSNGESLIKYDLSIERVGISCSTISEPDVNNYYSCYDYVLSDSDKEALAEYTLDMHDFYGTTVEEVVAFLDVLATHDKNLIYNTLIALGNDEIEVKQEIEYLKFDGYESGLVYWYQVDTGDSVSAEPVFNQDNEIYNNLLYDDEVKIYLTDFEGNVLVPPTLISDVASNGYVLYSDKNSHNVDTEEVIDKYKLKVWIDENVDPSYWPEDVDLIFNFKINVNAKEVENAATLMRGPDFNKIFDDYKENIVSAEFLVNDSDGVVDADYSFDVSDAGDGSVMAYLVKNAEDNTKYDLKVSTPSKVLYANSDCTSMFYNFKFTNFDGNNLNTSNVTSMRNMFLNTSLTTFDGSMWDTSQLQDIFQTFFAPFTYINISSWDSSSIELPTYVCMVGLSFKEENFITGPKWTIPFYSVQKCYD